MKLELIAATTFGLEAPVKRELIALGYKILKSEDGKITFLGDERAIVRANLWLRCSDRVQIKMAEFKALEFEDLFQQVKAVAWEEWIPPDGKFIVNGSSVKSKLSSVPACQSVAEKAVIERLKETYAIDRFEKSGALYDIKITILKDRVTVTLDTTGPSLHKRGYRQNSVAAPIKETLAAADWDSPLKIYAYDIDKKAIEAAMENAAEAGVADDIRFCRADSAKLCLSGQLTDMDKSGDKDKEGGIIITNPPYGERIGDKESIDRLYAGFRTFLKKNPTWSMFAITPDKAVEGLIFERPADRRRKLFNGRLEVCYYQYHGQKPKE